MNYVNANMTALEHFRIHGSVPDDVLEPILEREARVDDFDVSAYVEEARGCFPDEGFLQEQIDKLVELEKRVRGENKDTVFAIIHALSEIQDQVQSSAEYGADELRKAIKQLEKL